MYIQLIWRFKNGIWYTNCSSWSWSSSLDNNKETLKGLHITCSLYFFTINRLKTDF